MYGVKHHHQAGEGKTTFSKGLTILWCETSPRGTRVKQHFVNISQMEGVNQHHHNLPMTLCYSNINISSVSDFLISISD